MSNYEYGNVEVQGYPFSLLVSSEKRYNEQIRALLGEVRVRYSRNFSCSVLGTQVSGLVLESAGFHFLSTKINAKTFSVASSKLTKQSLPKITYSKFYLQIDSVGRPYLESTAPWIDLDGPIELECCFLNFLISYCNLTYSLYFYEVQRSAWNAELEVWLPKKQIIVFWFVLMTLKPTVIFA